MVDSGLPQRTLGLCGCFFGVRKKHVKSQLSFSLAKLSLSHLQQFVAPGFSTRKNQTFQKIGTKEGPLCYYRWKKSRFLPSTVAQFWFPIQIGKSTSITPDFTEAPPRFFVRKTTYSTGCFFGENPLPSHFSQLSHEKNPLLLSILPVGL